MKRECFILPHGSWQVYFCYSPLSLRVVYTSSWRSVTPSASSSLGKSPELPWLILVFGCFVAAAARSDTTFYGQKNTPWQQTQPLLVLPLTGHLPHQQLNCPIWTSLQRYHVEKKSPYSWVYQENNYICENIFRQRLKIAIRAGLDLES